MGEEGQRDAAEEEKQKGEVEEEKDREIWSRSKIRCVIAGLEDGGDMNQGIKECGQLLKTDNDLWPIVSKETGAPVLQPHRTEFCQ